MMIMTLDDRNISLYRDVELICSGRAAVKSPVARYSDAPVSYTDAPIQAASKTQKEWETTSDAPNRAVSKTVPSPTEPQTLSHRDASTVAARLTALVEPKKPTPNDATAMSASESKASAARTMWKTEAATENATSVSSSSMDKLTLNTAIQKPVLTHGMSASKRRRLKKAKRAAE
ncbi:unnamed protein product [Pieris macdunnoughi]|uniref:Uncharacterized protein n=1 Tax=Pieris macdunnoughi TaxID=345717 RepID=A0A821V283_9NEOP|nr:unnamed protein product [Pieris macdunnoughi]